MVRDRSDRSGVKNAISVAVQNGCNAECGFTQHAGTLKSIIAESASKPASQIGRQGAISTSTSDGLTNLRVLQGSKVMMDEDITSIG